MGADPRAALLAWCSETEGLTKRAAASPTRYSTFSSLAAERFNPYDRDVMAYLASRDPSSVLAQVAAIRAVIGLHKPTDGCPRRNCDRCYVVELLADGFTPGWRDDGH